MTADFHALCAELVETWDANLTDREIVEALIPAMNRARAALAEGAGVGVTDEELLACAAEVTSVDLLDFTESLEECCPFELTAMDLLDVCRSVLARYGTHPRPIPVAERLPAEVIEQAWKQHSKTPTFNDDEVVSLEGFRAAVADILAAVIPLPGEVDQ